jgi:uncharacterized membrane protein YfcA
MTWLVLVLGLAAGAVTTVAGQGGGLLLLLALTAVVGPHAALAITAPALLLGNFHRAFMLRKHVDRGVALRMMAGSLPGALLGGLLVGGIPAWFLRGLLVVTTSLAIAKALGALRFRVPRKALVPAGGVIGMMTGTSGGAGVLFAPVLLSFGLEGRAFVATTSTIAAATHVGRVIGYASVGIFSSALILPTIATSLAIFAGNGLADRLMRRSRRLHTRSLRAIEYGTLVICVALSVAGVG